MGHSDFEMIWSTESTAYSRRIAEAKRDVREREAAIKYHNEMLSCDLERLSSLQHAEQEQEDKGNVGLERRSESEKVESTEEEQN